MRYPSAVPVPRPLPVSDILKLRLSAYSDVTVTVSCFRAGACGLPREDRHSHIEHPLGAPIFYRDVPPMPSAVEKSPDLPEPLPLNSRDPAALIHHSCRSAVTGLIRIARRAGIQQASEAIASISSSTIASVTGSVGSTP